MKFEIRKLLVSAVFFLILVFLFRMHAYIGGTSATYDEPGYIARGYATLKTGDFRLRDFNAFLAPYVSSLPLFFSRVSFSEDNREWREAEKTRFSWHFSLDFFYNNRLPYGKILYRCRLMTAAVSLLLAFLVFLFAEELYGGTAAVLALFLYTFYPDILAHSGLATEELVFSLCLFAGVMFFWRYLNSPGLRGAALSGLFCALALNAKHTGLLLFPMLLLLAGIRPGNLLARRKILPDALCFLACFAAVFLVLYRFTHLGEYFASVREMAAHLKYGQLCFLAGKYSMHGFRRYYLVSFLLKTPLPFIILLALGAAVYRRRLAGYFLFIPPAVLFLSASFSATQAGHRYILPMYPFLFVFAGGAAARMLKTRWFAAPALLLALYAVNSVSIHPHYLAYFNELAGGPKNGYKYLVDSSLDWGQDLGGLKKYVKDSRASDVILSYFGAASRDSAGFAFQDLFTNLYPFDNEHLNSPEPSRELLAVSATHLQGVYFTPDIFEWLKSRKPERVIGYSIFVYDITADVYAHERLLNMYFYAGEKEKCVREIERIRALDPRNRYASLILSFVRADGGETKEALEEFGKAAGPDPERMFDCASMVTSPLAAKAYVKGFSRIKELCVKKGSPGDAGAADYWKSRILYLYYENERTNELWKEMMR